MHTKSEQKVLGNWFCMPIIFKNPLKTVFSIKNILIQFVSGVFELQWDISYLKNWLLIDYQRLLVYKNTYNII